MGIVKISDQLHDEIRVASQGLCRSINAQAEFWIRLGRACELNPTLSGAELLKLLVEEAKARHDQNS
ncbi:ParD-like family protein [Gallaecimonas kandeliae]|uniref:ParD-like family protein n=1 Tax=Gallaecimonas kandeliae TaxID=3029055 RepID=UPI0026477C21|nr:ParD-like family protein [Gallaecimonas kandeliae]WKE64879.1 ParD-like family protein [Gallaecimonas kandeliae]